MSRSEQNQNPEADTASARTRKVKWVVAGLLLLFVTVAAMSLPSGYSDDLTRIGKGKVAVVLIRDKNAVASFDLIHVMDGLRDKYAGRVEFLLTDFDTSEGRAFIDANKVTPVTLVLFDASGNLRKVLYAPQTAGSVQQELSTELGVSPQ